MSRSALFTGVLVALALISGCAAGRALRKQALDDQVVSVAEKQSKDDVVNNDNQAVVGQPVAGADEDVTSAGLLELGEGLGAGTKVMRSRSLLAKRRRRHRVQGGAHAMRNLMQSRARGMWLRDGMTIALEAPCTRWCYDYKRRYRYRRRSWGHHYYYVYSWSSKLTTCYDERTAKTRAKTLQHRNDYRDVGEPYCSSGGSSGGYCTDTGSSWKCNQKEVGQKQTFTIKRQKGHSDRIAIKGPHHNRWCMDVNGRMKCTHSQEQWFRFETTGSNQIKLWDLSNHKCGTDTRYGWAKCTSSSHWLQLDFVLKILSPGPVADEPKLTDGMAIALKVKGSHGTNMFCYSYQWYHGSLRCSSMSSYADKTFTVKTYGASNSIALTCNDRRNCWCIIGDNGIRCNSEKPVQFTYYPQGDNKIAFKAEAKQGSDSWCAVDGHSRYTHVSSVGCAKKDLTTEGIFEIVQQTGPELKSDMVISLKYAEGDKYCADESEKWSCSRRGVGRWEKFTVKVFDESKANHDGSRTIALKGGRSGKWCHADPTKSDAAIRCDRDSPGDTGNFTYFPQGGKQFSRKNYDGSTTIALKGTISLKAHSGKWCSGYHGGCNSAEPDFGAVFEVEEQQKDAPETPLLPDGAFISLGTPPQSYYTKKKICETNNKGKPLKCDRQLKGKVPPKAKFAVKMLGNFTVGLKAHHLAKWCRGDNKGIYCDRESIGDSEKFTYSPQGGNMISLKAGGKWCSYDLSGQVKCKTDYVNYYEKFEMQIETVQTMPKLTDGMIIEITSLRKERKRECYSYNTNWQGYRYCSRYQYKNVIVREQWRDDGDEIAAKESYVDASHPYNDERLRRQFKVKHLGGLIVALAGGLNGKWCRGDSDKISCDSDTITPEEEFTYSPEGGKFIALRGGKSDNWCNHDASWRSKHRITCDEPVFDPSKRSQKLEITEIEKPSLPKLKDGTVITLKSYANTVSSAGIGKRSSSYGWCRFDKCIFGRENLRDYCVRCNQQQKRWNEVDDTDNTVPSNVAKFKIKLFPKLGNVFALANVKSGKWCADDGDHDGALRCDRDEIRGWEKFSYSAGGTDQDGHTLIGIKGGRSKTWCAPAAQTPQTTSSSTDETIKCFVGHLGLNQMYEVEQHVDIRDGMVLAIKAGERLSGGKRARKYCSDTGNSWDCNNEFLGNFAKFTVKVMDQDTSEIALQSRRHNKWCRGNRDGIFCDSDSIGTEQKFVWSSMPGGREIILRLNSGLTPSTSSRPHPWCYASNANQLVCGYDRKQTKDKNDKYKTRLEVEVESLTDGMTIALKGRTNDKFCSDNAGDKMTCNHDEITEREKFKIKRVDAFEFALSADSGKWCRGSPTGIRCDQDKMSNSTTFAYSPAADDGIIALRVLDGGSDDRWCEVTTASKGTLKCDQPFDSSSATQEFAWEAVQPEEDDNDDYALRPQAAKTLTKADPESLGGWAIDQLGSFLEPPSEPASPSPSPPTTSSP